MKFVNAYNQFFERYFPSPLSIAIILSFITFVFCLTIFNYDGNLIQKSAKIGEFWFEGIWNQNLLSFTVHMMLILVLGHILALSKPAQYFINFGLKFCTDTANSAFVIAFFTIIVSFFNWGLGLIFGAVFARKIGENFQKNQKPLNYPLIGASAYAGMMIWHGGVSGSATLTIAGNNHSLIDKIGMIALTETTFSTMNIVVSALLLLIIPISLYLIGKQSKATLAPKLITKKVDESNTESQALDKSNVFGVFTGIVILGFFVYLNFEKIKIGNSPFTLINLETTNLLLLGLCFLMHQNIQSFSKALEEAIGGASGILIQFPIYFGIMGMMQKSGLGLLLAENMANIQSELWMSVYTFASAGAVNMFIPSGGGQWQMQGPIIADAALKTGADLPKLIMALCYGDQLTNMLQPFWALPLLGITGLKAKEILPYTLLVFVIGSLIFLFGLIIF